MGALPGSDRTHLKALAGIFGCQGLVGRDLVLAWGLFLWSFFPLVVCLLTCVWINLKVGELPSFSLFPK